MVATDDLERFMSYTERDPESGCLLWTGAPNSTGRGAFWAEGKTWGAHRWIFREKYGYLPPAVMHRCDNPLCVNWEECLIPGTKGENNTDRSRKGRNSDRSGMRNPACKLTDEQCDEIRSEYGRGVLTQQMLGEIYGVTGGQISCIVNGKRGKRGPRV